jgi:hypothetical protein
MNKLLILLPLCIYLTFFSCSNPVTLPNSADAQTQEAKKAKDEYKRERREMVEQQIRARGIQDESVLEAMIKVPRHKFVPDTLVKEAYIDSPLPIGLQSDNLTTLHRRLYDRGCRHL